MSNQPGAEEQETQDDTLNLTKEEENILDSLDQKTKDIFSGSLDGLPAMPSNIVRIFLSSTFSGNLQIRKAVCDIFHFIAG